MNGQICPECAQGKHPNCTVDVLNDDDQMVPCECSCTNGSAQ